MAEYRYFKVTNRKKSGWAGRGMSVKIYRHRGTWAFFKYEGFMWAKQWGFKSKLAAVRGAARYLGEGWRLERLMPLV